MILIKIAKGKILQRIANKHSQKKKKKSFLGYDYIKRHNYR